MVDKQSILIFESTHTLTNFLLKEWTKIAKDAIEARGRFTVALSGGRTPLEFYSRLSSFEDFDLWKKTYLFQADEHCTVRGIYGSNFNMIKTSLLDYVNIPLQNVFPVKTDLESAALCAEHYKDMLVHFFAYQMQAIPQFDLIMLGVGIDGHTASLFSGLEGINDTGRVTMPVSLDYLKEDRITLTLNVINNARRVIYLILGKQKAEIVKSILEERMVCPASAVNPVNGELIFLLDKEAASALSNRDSFVVQYDHLFHQRGV